MKAPGTMPGSQPPARLDGVPFDDGPSGYAGLTKKLGMSPLTLGALLLLQFLLAASLYVTVMSVDRDDVLGAFVLHSGAIGLFVTALLALHARRIKRADRERFERSRSAEGIVESVASTGIKGEDLYVEIPRLRFTAADGQERSSEAAQRLDGLTAGEVVAVRYDPDDPSWVIVDGPDPLKLRAIARMLWWFGGVSVAGLVVGSLLLKFDATALPSLSAIPDWLLPLGGGLAMMAAGVYYVRATIRARRQVQERAARAREVSATVVQVDESIQSGRRVQPTFAFRTFNAEDLTVRSKFTLEGKKDAARVPLNANIRVLYDPEDPEYVWPVGVKMTSLNRETLIVGCASFAIGLFMVVGSTAFPE